jgi:hypothetical protein
MKLSDILPKFDVEAIRARRNTSSIFKKSVEKLTQMPEEQLKKLVAQLEEKKENAP